MSPFRLQTFMAKKPQPLAAEQVRLGLRVRATGHYARGRIGILTGVIDRSYPRPRVEVIPEGLALSRLDTWALAEAVLLPEQQQLRALGGSFNPPKGYPLITTSPES